MPDVYVVTHGEYSDYHICGVFSTFELAETYRKKYAYDSFSSNIETWELDKWMDKINLGLSLFKVKFEPSESLTITRISNVDPHHIIRIEETQPTYTDKWKSGNRKEVSQAIWYLWAKDAEQVRKVAAEKHRKWLVQQVPLRFDENSMKDMHEI